MPAVLPPASKYLAQKWQEERFRVHRDRVRHAPSLLDMSAPKIYPHLKLAVNKLALEEERQARYDRENQKLLNKIKIIVKGHGTCDNWNTYVKKDLHTQARMKQQKEIEWENLQMLKRIKATKPVIQKKKQLKDFQKHRQHQELRQSTSKDYTSPRAGGKAYSEFGSLTDRSEKSVTREPSEKSAIIEEEEEEEEITDLEEKDEETEEKKEQENLPPLPEGKKRKTNKPPPENRKKNRNATVPKLPKI